MRGSNKATGLMYRRTSLTLYRRVSRLVAVLAAVSIGVAMLVVLSPRPASAAACPCTIWPSTATPAVPADPEVATVELGIRFRADEAGSIIGVRFYKGDGNTGTHTGSLWENNGIRLATVTFTGESATGWQQADFAAPVAISAGTTYVASYYAPNGRYAADEGFFSAGGVTNGPLTALQDGVDGGNGVYRYGAGGGFPSSTYGSTNYWVDVVFQPSSPDTTKPSVTGTQPAADATNIPVTSGVSATFSEQVQAGTVVAALSAGAGPVAITQNYNAATRTVSLTPTSNLAVSTVYTASISGAMDTAGNVMDPVGWSFTTASTVITCPCTIWPPAAAPVVPAANDSSAVELGVKFRADRNGYVKGLRFYKGAGNTGVHVGSLWSNGGTKLASVTFSAESASGWQQATLPAPVPVTMNTTYVASYYAPVGRYAGDNYYFASSGVTRGPLAALENGVDGGNGVYRYGASGFPASTYNATNYWVDIVFDVTASDAVAPTVVLKAPAAGAYGVPTNTTVMATYSEQVVGSSVTMQLRGPSNEPVPATVAYNGSSQKSTLTPSAVLANSTTYTAMVSGARDPAGNTMSPIGWTFTTAAPVRPPDQGPGGPIAVVTSSSNPYSKYLAEILRAEGVNEFSVIDVSAMSATTLAAFDVVVIGNIAVTATQASVLTSWVSGGGNLIAMRPNATLADLLGISAVAGTTSNAYLRVDSATAAGAGIVSETIQYHGTADRYALSGAQAVASIYSNATTATTFPAVTLRNVGSSGGQAAAFTFDLSRSIVLTRQGNPAWAGQERDGIAPIRSDDLYVGGASTDWVDLAKVAIPQADEQQRLLANLIQVTARDRKPLPRFWYFPRDVRAVVVATGDDHGTGGTAGRLDKYEANSPAGCSVGDWACLRLSSYVYPGTPLSDNAAAGYVSRGFEIGLHPQNGCLDFTPASLANTYTQDRASWAVAFPSLPNPVTSRFHCIVYSDWASQPKTELANGMRLDTNYYYWPGSWMQDRPGFMTGSGMPMRFADTNGAMVDVYQAATQMTDESDQSYPFTPNALLGNALGPLGYYGAFTANLHTDRSSTFEDDQVIASARARGVPVISAKQLLTWTDGRNASSFTNISWNAGTLSFGVAVGAGADGLSGMLPTAGPDGLELVSLSRDGAAVPFVTKTIKGQEYATFSASPGAYSAAYTASGALSVTSTQTLMPAGGPDGAVTIAWATTKPATAEVALGTAPDNLAARQRSGEASSTHSVLLSGLEPGTTYYYRVTSQDTAGNKRTYPEPTQPPATFATLPADRTPPKSSDPVITPLPDGTVRVKWTTDEVADSVVRFGRSAGDLSGIRLDTSLVHDHTVVLTGLAANQAYLASVSSSDAAGNGVSGQAVPFATTGMGVADQTTAAFRKGRTAGDAHISPSGFGSITLSTDDLPGKAASSWGSFVSGVLDARAMVDWEHAMWQADVPAGSTLRVSVRTGSTATPDSTWTAWQAVPANGGKLTGSSRYIEYRVEMTSARGAVPPALYTIGFTNNGVPMPSVGEGSQPG